MAFLLLLVESKYLLFKKYSKAIGSTDALRPSLLPSASVMFKRNPLTTCLAT